MVSIKIENDEFVHLGVLSPFQQINRIVETSLKELEKVLRLYVAAHLLFISIILSQFLFLIFSFSLLNQSLLFGVGLAVFFLTFFSYFLFRAYSEARKCDQTIQIIDRYILSCKETIHYQNYLPEHHLELAEACRRFADRLNRSEYELYALNRGFPSLCGFLEKWGCYCHWKDIYITREALLLQAVQEHVKLVKSNPTSLEAHTALANAYVVLSGLYLDLCNPKAHEEDRWLPEGVYDQEIAEKFQKTAERAIEEFKILVDYAPQDPWIHEQLAYSYRDLKMPLEEIREYEKIIQINPFEKEILFKLGVLYLQQGKHAAGLQIYEKLKRLNYKKAECLMEHYGLTQNV